MTLLEAAVEPSVAVVVENFGTAEVAAGLFLLHILRQNSAELVDVLDVLDFKHGAGLILRMNLDGTEAKQSLSNRALHGHILHSVEKNFIFVGAEKAQLIDKLLAGDGVGGE